MKDNWEWQRRMRLRKDSARERTTLFKGRNRNQQRENADWEVMALKTSVISVSVINLDPIYMVVTPKCILPSQTFPWTPTFISHYLFNISTWRPDKYFKHNVSKTKTKVLISPLQTRSSLNSPHFTKFKSKTWKSSVVIFLSHTSPANPISANPTGSMSPKRNLYPATSHHLLYYRPCPTTRVQPGCLAQPSNRPPALTLAPLSALQTAARARFLKCTSDHVTLLLKTF